MAQYTSGDRRSSIYVVATPYYQKIQKLEDIILGKVLADGMQELGELGVKVAKAKVLSSGTPYSEFRQRFGLGRSGRYVTGKMYNSIVSKLEVGPKQMRERVGFDKNKEEPYFKLQESGFWNVWKFNSYGGATHGPHANTGFAFTKVEGRKTEGMFALRDAKEEMLAKREALFSKIKRMIGSI